MKTVVTRAGFGFLTVTALQYNTLWLRTTELEGIVRDCTYDKEIAVCIFAVSPGCKFQVCTAFR